MQTGDSPTWWRRRSNASSAARCSPRAPGSGKSCSRRARASRSRCTQWKDGEETSLGFKMLRGPDDRWRLYDVLMGGVSLVGNYRAQFATVLRRGSYADMIKRIRTQGARQKE